MKVSNMIGNSGNEIANQFIIQEATKCSFQSYDSIIAVKEVGQPIKLDRNTWNYSVTTGKYRNMFLGEKKADTQKKIDSGEYILADLN